MGKIEVVGLGALNVDHIYKVERILEDGEAMAEEAGAFPGGSAANTIYGLARLGISTGFIGAVGDDAAGKLLTGDFNKMGVDTSRIVVKQGQASGSTLCLSARNGKRSIYVSPGANSLLENKDIDLTYINNAGVIHISSFANPEQLRLITELAAKISPDVELSFSPGELYAAMGLDRLSVIISRTHLLFTNQSEMAKLTGSDIKVGAAMCIEKGCRIVVVTLGKGEKLGGDKQEEAVCYIRDADNEYLIEALERDETAITDSTGAGDAFATGFLYGWLKGKGLEECAQLGDTVARSSLTGLGARQGLPTPTRLEQCFRQLYSQRL